MNNSSFEFYGNYEEKLMKLQPEVYTETRRILDGFLQKFMRENNKKARVLDVGGAGLITFDSNLADTITVLDLFKKPNEVRLPENARWEVGNILDSKSLYEEYDLIILSSVIHHLADKGNNIIKNTRICFSNCKKTLSGSGYLYIFDGTCPFFLSKLQDLFYPFYIFLLLKFFKFTYVRIPSLSEINNCLKLEGFMLVNEFFKQPKWIGQMYWRVPLKFYPLRFSCIKAYLK